MNQTTAEEIAEEWIEALRRDSTSISIPPSLSVARSLVESVLEALTRETEMSGQVDTHSDQRPTGLETAVPAIARLVRVLRESSSPDSLADVLRAVVILQGVIEERWLPTTSPRISAGLVKSFFRKIVMGLVEESGGAESSHPGLAGSTWAVSGGQARRRVTPSYAMLRAALDSCSEGVVLLDTQGIVMEWNSAMTEMTGYAAEEAVGRPCSSVLDVLPSCCRREDRDGAPDFAPPWWLSAKEGNAVLRGKDGREVWTRVRTTAHVDEQGKPRCTVCTFLGAEDREQTEHLKDEFLALASHELRTPLTSIKGYASFLLREERFDRHLVETIVQQSNLMARLISDLLDTSLLRSGQVNLCRARVNVAELAAEVIEHVSRVHPDHRFALKSDDDLPAARGDRDRIEQVLAHLLENAISYSPLGSMITVAMRLAHEADHTARGGSGSAMLVVSVSDQGIGITPQDIPHIFERFYRANRGEVQRVPGIGMGLYRARVIVEAHGGGVWVHSVPGVGSTFCFSLPRDDQSDG